MTTFEHHFEHDVGDHEFEFVATYKVIPGCKGYSNPLRGIYEPEEPASIEIITVEKIGEDRFGKETRHEYDDNAIYDYLDSIEDKLLEDARNV